MRILVTGGYGFIGKSLCRELIRLGHTVVILDIIPKPKVVWSEKVRYVQWDITKPLLRKDFPKVSPIDFVFHLAAMVDIDEIRKRRAKAFKVNIKGTFNIVDFCNKHNIPLAFTSSACVYGHTKYHPTTEEVFIHPTTWYGVTKKIGENLVKMLDKYVILRLGTVVGSEMRDSVCTSVFLKAAMNKKPFPIRGSGKQTRNWIYIDDIVNGCVDAMHNCLSGCSCCEKETFNLVGQPFYSVNELADICYGIVHGRGKTYSITKLPARPNDVIREDISCQKAKDLLGWNPNISLRKGLREIFKEWKKNGRWK